MIRLQDRHSGTKAYTKYSSNGELQIDQVIALAIDSAYCPFFTAIRVCGLIMFHLQCSAVCLHIGCYYLLAIDDVSDVELKLSPLAIFSTLMGLLILITNDTAE